MKTISPALKLKQTRRGCAKYIQAPDVSWNKPFKAFKTEQYDGWISKGLHKYTKADNLKAPPRRQIVEWILNAWGKLPKDLIKKSFKCCGLNLPCEAGAAIF